MKYSKMALLVIYLCCLFSYSLQTKKVNCRKYVYAPICRGVAAKRATSQADFDVHHKRFAERRNSFPLDDAFTNCITRKQLNGDKNTVKGVIEKLNRADGYPTKYLLN